MALLISPSILSADLGNLERDLRACEAGGADSIHVDVMDGRFVPNITFGPVMVETCRAITALPLDVHLMIVEPERHLEAFARAGADALTVHYETCPHIHRTLQSIRELGMKAGISFNPGTPLDPLRYLGDVVDQVLIMTVNPGFGGQRYIPVSELKIKDCAALLAEEGSEALIQIDGGVEAANIARNYQAGARSFIAGTAVFRHAGGIAAGIQALRAAVAD
mgnify:FL=1